MSPIFLKKESIAVKFLLTYSHKSLEVFSRHAEIHVFIPRDKAAVTYCSEQRAGNHKIRNVMLGTNALNFFRNDKF